jgi:hypothetical protein
MAKRLTNTAKWLNEEFRTLGPLLKLAWLYVLDACDHCGIWDANFSLLSYSIGSTVEITREEFVSAFADQIKILPQSPKIFIPAFITQQYGTLSEKSKPHQAVIKALKEHKLWNEKTKGYLTLSIPLPNPYLTLSDQIPERMEFEFNALYEFYPRHEGKAKGVLKLQKTIKTSEAFESFCIAVENYTKLVQSEKRARQYIMRFDTFVNNYEDHVNPDYLKHIESDERVYTIQLGEGE